MDSRGTIYVTGSSGGALDGVANASQEDIVPQKYDSNGVKLWTRLVSGVAA